MRGAQTIPDELKQAARNLEARYRILNVPVRNVPPKEWDALNEQISSLIPEWFVVLLANYRLVGGVLRITDPRKQCDGGFCLWWPEIYAQRFSSGDELLAQEIVGQGFIPLSDEAHGNLWVIEKTSQPTSPVYLWDLSSQKILFAFKSLAMLLSVAQVSTESFANSPTRPACLMWDISNDLEQSG